MKTVQPLTDQLSIGLSMACAMHCLMLPVLLALLPSVAALQLDNEAFHFWMVAVILPTSIYALTLGCKQHKRYRFLMIGFSGLALLVMALVLGEARIGEAGEKILTLIGSLLVAVGHWYNFKLCRAKNNTSCGCKED